MTSNAHAKLLLFGEHAAVYGYPALGLALPWTISASFTTATQSKWSFPTADAEQEPLLRNLVTTLENLRIDEGEPPLQPSTVRLRSDIPIGAGFGSSAALCAALVRLFFPRKPLEFHDQVAWELEKTFHGTPSGIDTALALRSGFWSLETTTIPPSAISLASPILHLVLGAIPRQKTTKELVGTLRNRWQEGDAEVRRSIGKIGKIAEEAVTLFSREAGDADFLYRLADMVRVAQTELSALGLGHPLFDRLFAKASETGGLAGKLSGAGGGGAFFLLFSNHETAQRAVPELCTILHPQEWLLRPQYLEIKP